MCELKRLQYKKLRECYKRGIVLELYEKKFISEVQFKRLMQK